MSLNSGSRQGAWAHNLWEGVNSVNGQDSSLGEGAAAVSLGAVLMEEGVQVRVQVECGREEVED